MDLADKYIDDDKLQKLGIDDIQQDDSFWADQKDKATLDYFKLKDGIFNHQPN